MGVLCKREAAPQNLVQASAKHQEAFGLYLRRRFREAGALFRQVNTLLEENGVKDRVSLHLADLCEKLLALPELPHGWDGSEALQKKSFRRAGGRPRERMGLLP